MGTPNQPMTARIQQATHADAVAEKVVKYDTLKPLASMWEQHPYQLELEVNMSSFIFYMKAIEIDGKLRDMVCSGKVTAIRGHQYTVHVYDPSAQHKCYLPGWVNGSKDKSQKKQPKESRNRHSDTS